MKLKFRRENLGFYLIVSLLVVLNVGLFFFWGGNSFKEDKIVAEAYFKGPFLEIEQIKGKNFNFRQLSNFFGNLAKQKGGAYAYEALAQATAKSYLAHGVDTHLLGHIVGDILFKQMGIEGIKYCTSDLRNACSHSIVVGLLLQDGEGALIKAVSVCRDAPGGSGAYTMCVHGLGHGVLAYVDYDMKRAVKMCEKTAPVIGVGVEYVQCVGGVTMEMMAGINDRDAWLLQAPNYLKKDDPLSPCNMSFMSEQVRPICYTYLTPHLFELAGANLQKPDPVYFAKAFSFCSKLKEHDKNRGFCYGGFGKEFVVLANERNIQSIENLNNEQLKKIYDWCVMADAQDGMIACVGNALQSLYWGGENSPAVSIKFCSLVNVSKDQSACFSGLIDAVKYYNKDVTYHKNFCNQVPKNYQNQCLSVLIKN